MTSKSPNFSSEFYCPYRKLWAFSMFKDDDLKFYIEFLVKIDMIQCYAFGNEGIYEIC